MTTVANDSSGAMSVQNAPDPATHGLSRGAATWVERTSEGKPYFLVGQYAGTDITVTVAAGTQATMTSTIIATPNPAPLAVNDIDWGGNPTTKDIIEIYNDKNICYNLQWSVADNEWGCLVKEWSATKKRRVSRWKNDYVIPAGVGMRYKRTGGAFSVTLPVLHVRESGN